jgi:catechol 2,3-dioxygenase-like lactoylglutathione lyase family enzyme
MIRGLGAIIIGVQEMERSIAFYRDILGLALWPDSGAYAAFEVGQATILLSEAHWEILGARPSAGILLALNVKDLDAARGILIERGVSIVTGPIVVAGARVLRLQDPDGHLLSLVEAPRVFEQAAAADVS